MLTQQTLDKLYAMKLNGMADALKELIQQPHTQDLSFEERVALFVDRQWTWKEDRRLKRLLQIARLKINASTEDIDFRTPRGLDKSVILQLAQCEWITNAQNIIITGPTGVGKTRPGRLRIIGRPVDRTAGRKRAGRNAPPPTRAASPEKPAGLRTVAPKLLEARDFLPVDLAGNRTRGVKSPRP